MAKLGHIDYIGYMMSRQPKYTSSEIVEALKLTKGMIYQAAEKLSCSPTTIYNYAKRYKSVEDELKNQRGLFLDKTEIALEEAIDRGEGWAIAFALKTLGRNRGYADKQIVEQHSYDLNGLSVEQLKRLANGEELSDVLGD